MTTAERFWAKVQKTESCWLWTGGTTKRGYGVFRIGSVTDGTRRQVGAHVFSFQLAGGIVEPGNEVHHKCRQILCVNPDHLEKAASHRAHLSKHLAEFKAVGARQAHNPKFVGSSARARSARPRCKNGHMYTTDNIHWRGNERVCRRCLKASGIRSRIKKGQDVTPAIRAWLTAFEREVAAYHRRHHNEARH